MDLTDKLNQIRTRLEDATPILGKEFKETVLWLIDSEKEKQKMTKMLRQIPDPRPINHQQRRLLKKAIDTFLWKRELLT